MSGLGKGGYSIQWVTEQLAVGHAPMSPDQLDDLKVEGVNAILNLCGEFCDLHQKEAEHGFEVYYMPVVDEEAPELTELEKALAWLDEAIYLGKKVLIHCRHGIGRTGTVLNAYMLRRGLSHWQAGKTLKGLKSKPANFEQWWAIRKYGKKSGRLTVREPSLESKHLVDLSPFFRDYEALVALLEQALDESAMPRCGDETTACCGTAVSLSLVEAVYLSSRINLEFTSEERLGIIDRAVEVARRERAEAQKTDAGDAEFCLSRIGAVCPLLSGTRCLLFNFRPLQCRGHGLDSRFNTGLWEETLAPKLEALSREVFFAFTSEFAKGPLPHFALADVASGRYVQTFFHYLLKGGA